MPSFPDDSDALDTGESNNDEPDSWDRRWEEKWSDKHDQFKDIEANLEEMEDGLEKRWEAISAESPFGETFAKDAPTNEVSVKAASESSQAEVAEITARAYASAMRAVSRITTAIVLMILPTILGRWLDLRLGITFLAALGAMLGMIAGIGYLMLKGKSSNSEK